GQRRAGAEGPGRGARQRPHRPPPRPGRRRGMGRRRRRGRSPRDHERARHQRHAPRGHRLHGRRPAPRRVPADRGPRREPADAAAQALLRPVGDRAGAPARRGALDALGGGADRRRQGRVGRGRAGAQRPATTERRRQRPAGHGPRRAADERRHGRRRGHHRCTDLIVGGWVGAAAVEPVAGPVVDLAGSAGGAPDVPLVESGVAGAAGGDPLRLEGQAGTAPARWGTLARPAVAVAGGALM
ncbi:MAG: hypothetical protein AVDCRST_MAG20-963, partial [uncultured Acidimicrobiales bacterium]